MLKFEVTTKNRRHILIYYIIDETNKVSQRKHLLFTQYLQRQANVMNSARAHSEIADAQALKRRPCRVPSLDRQLCVPCHSRQQLSSLGSYYQEVALTRLIISESWWGKLTTGWDLIQMHTGLYWWPTQCQLMQLYEQWTVWLKASWPWSKLSVLLTACYSTWIFSF